MAADSASARSGTGALACFVLSACSLLLPAAAAGQAGGADAAGPQDVGAGDAPAGAGVSTAGPGGAAEGAVDIIGGAGGPVLRELAEPGGGEFGDDAIDALARAHERYVEAGDGESALQAAALLREIHEARYGADSYEVLPWLRLHAEAFARLERHEDAQRAYERAVALTERYEGPFSFRLVELLMSQAQTLVELREMEAAESVMMRAKFITHRRLGINNLEQVPIVRSLSNLYLSTYAGEKAEREQQFLLRLYERNYGDTPALAEGLYEYADYYMTIGDYQAAIPVYRRALEVLEQAYGENDLRLVEPLRGIANAHIRRDSRRGEAEDALERVVRLYEQEENADVYDHALSLRDLGDWHMRTGDTGAAIEAYARAWDLLVEVDGNEGRARRLLGEPEELDYISPPNVYDSYERRPFLSADRYLETSFTVKPDGRVTDAVVLDGTAGRRTEFESLRALRMARFRPAFADGEPVSAVMTWRQYYSD